MTTACDVADFILFRQGAMSAMKLQKLVYYSQAWSLVWDERPLFADRIEAWANGPVTPVLYEEHRGRFQVEPGSIGGDRRALDATAVETVEAVLRFYGDRTAQWLSDLTHAEAPWRQARVGLDDGDRGQRVITLASMAEYYSGL